jgi:hypothetical protein
MTSAVSGIVRNEVTNRLMGEASAGGDDYIAAMPNALSIEYLQPEDIANAVARLVSDEARYIHRDPAAAGRRFHRPLRSSVEPQDQFRTAESIRIQRGGAPRAPEPRNAGLSN